MVSHRNLRSRAQVVCDPRATAAERWALSRAWRRCDAVCWVQAGKTELTESLGVHSRDLRVLDAQRSNSSYPSCILCREKALVINLEFIQVRLPRRRLLRLCRHASALPDLCPPQARTVATMDLPRKPVRVPLH